MGLHIMTAGSYAAEKDGGTVYSKMLSDSSKKFFVKEGKLKGYILIGDILGGGIYTSLIREKTPLDTCLLYTSIQRVTTGRNPYQSR